MENYLNLAPYLIAAVVFLLQLRLFVTPENLEKKHRQILDDVEKKFATLSMFNALSDRFADMQCKIDKIYGILLEKK